MRVREREMAMGNMLTFSVFSIKRETLKLNLRRGQWNFENVSGEYVLNPNLRELSVIFPYFFKYSIFQSMVRS